MQSIVEAFESKKHLLVGEGVSDEMVKKAESELGIIFPVDYRKYLITYGVAAYNGHELTGITKSDRTNVVAVTKASWAKNPTIPKSMYVIEETNVEEMIIWQSETGKVFYSSPNQPLTELCDSFTQYILR
ncbi:SMI1-KNR4 cell-wall [Oribacterium sp. KHPX15]|uniref:SMI1/KNR4 family protein n=1 Tax=Oribacterium sp. KHPX15 TaxID=1855342 RepID=UPI0008999242|nr:SMI1/KNR4 family protein [Oribacterium sp. KHPX15]SEA49750.1 SMI1-KNR4 cell-wall [Oribacterium sp. KHPX15]